NCYLRPVASRVPLVLSLKRKFPFITSPTEPLSLVVPNGIGPLVTRCRAADFELPPQTRARRLQTKSKFPKLTFLLRESKTHRIPNARIVHPSPIICDDNFRGIEGNVDVESRALHLGIDRVVDEFGYSLRD